MNIQKDGYQLDKASLAARVKHINHHFGQFEQTPAMQKLAKILLLYCATLETDEQHA